MRTEVLDKNAYIKTFKKKFDNVLRKVPVQATAEIVEPKVTVSVITHEDDLVYELDYSIPVKENIFNIRKDLMMKTFPVFEVVESQEVPLSIEEKDALISEGMSVEEGLSKTKMVETKVHYLIEKVIIDRDEMIVMERGTVENLRHRYKLNMPISIFLKRMREQWTPKEVSDNFKEKAKYVNRIFDEKSWDTMNKTDGNKYYPTKAKQRSYSE